MNSQYMPIVAAAAIVVVTLVLLAIWASRYVKVSPNRVLIVSGRQCQRPDGTRVGFRIVKGGGTFVFPVIEKAEVLTLEPLNIEMPPCKVRTAKGMAVQTDCLVQVKIKSDDGSIIAAAENFLGKNEFEIGSTLRPIVEKHLRAVLGALNADEIDGDRGRCAAKVQTAAATDLDRMGLCIIGFTIRAVETVA